MKLQTHIPTIKLPFKIDHHDSMCFFGSCFAEYIGNILLKQKFDCLINPLGIGYNPISTINLIQLDNEDIDWKMAQKSNEVYFMYEFHSKFNNTKLSDFKSAICKAIEKKNQYLEKATVLFISLGTAYTHRLISSNKIVTNCHKQPSAFFERQLLEVNEIKKSLLGFTSHINKTYKKEFQFVFTVSPVRHLKDGFRENQISKSILHLAIDECVKNNQGIHYFPAYEILMDDLRDYRFYDRDLLHPNYLAVEYIWEYFSRVFFSAETQNLNSEIAQAIKSLQHKPFQKNTLMHQNFVKDLIAKIKLLSDENDLNFDHEILQLEAQLN